MGQRQDRKGRSGRGEWPRWLAASGLFHALLLGGLLLAGGPAGRPPGLLRARLVTEIKAVAVPASERQPRAAREARKASPAPASRGKTIRMAAAPALREAVSRSAVARPAPGPESAREVPAPEAVPGPPAALAKEKAAPAGPIGGGQARPGGARADPPGPEAPPSLLEANEAPVAHPSESGAGTRGILLVPAGSGGGTGGSWSGGSGDGTETGGGGGGSGGIAREGPGSLGGAGTGVTASRGGTGGPGDGEGTAGLLRRIRQQIEQAKIYPDGARREGIQGTVELRFRIAADGSVEAVQILRSSGSRLLDEVSEETIRRAAPYPVVRGWIRLPLSYRLDR